MKSKHLLIALFLIGFYSLKSQEESARLYKSHKCEYTGQLVFDKDSLEGFSETLAWQQAVMNGYDISEQKVVVAIAKRNFIDFKYGYKVEYKGGGTNAVQSGCSNVDFEAGSIIGWTAVEGDNNNSTTHAMGTLSSTTQTLICNPGYTDPNGVPITGTSPLGGKFLRLGQTGTGGTAYKISQTFTVTPANSVFVYSYAVVLEDGSHTCSEQPYFNIAFNDCGNNPIPCGQYAVVAGGSACSSGVDPSFVTSGAYKYKQWTTAAFDLTSYIGSCVTINFQVAGCVITQGAHAGYCYIDASCQPMSMTLNGNQIPVGQTNNSTCGAVSSNTLCAPAGFTYSWTGPGVTGQTGQCINTSSIGSYSVSLGQAGASCFNPILYSNFTAAPNPTITSSLTQPVCSFPVGSATVSATSGTGPITYSWTPSVTSPTSTSNTNLPPGSNYTVTATDSVGCSASTTFSVNNFSGSPSYTLANNPGLVLSCTSPSVTLTFAPTSTNTSTSWQGPSGVISGTTAVATAAGSYSYTAINTISSCSVTGVVNVTGSLAIPVLTSTVTQPVCALPVGSATVSTANGTAPYSYSWTPSAASSTSTTNSNLPPGTGYTVTVTDSVGCTGVTTFSVNNFAGAPSYTLANNPGLVLSCTSPSVTLTFAPTSTNTSTSWQGPSGVISGTTTVATAAGSYSYTAINTISSCSVTGVVNVTGSLAIPVLTSTVTQPVCALPVGSATVSTANGTAPYSYSWTPSAASSTSTTNSNLPPGTGYTVTVTDSVGCTGVTTFSVNNFAGAPSYTLANNPGLLITCSSPSVTLTFAPTSTNTSTSWQGPSGAISGTTTVATAAGTYSYTALNTVSTCSVTGNIIVTSNTLIPQATYTSVCNTNTINLSASSDSTGIILGWTLPTTPTTSIVGPVVTSTAIGVYTLTAVDPTNGCSQTYTTSTAVPPVNITTSPSSILTCATQTVLATSSSSTPSVIVTWSNGTTTSTVNPYPISSVGTYTTNVQIVGGCSSQSVITISSNTVANVSIIPSSTIIPCATGSVALNAVSGVGGPYTYVWSPSSPTFTGSTFTATNPNTYSVIALNTVNGCTATASQFVGIESINASFVANPYQGLMPLAVTFTNTSTNATDYNWNLGNGTTYTTTNASTVYNSQGTFTVILTATNGFCQDTAIRFIKVDVISQLIVPNVFTPNGDGKNDVFTFDAKNMGEITLTIFDRWGLKMFESTDSGNVRWDGKNKGGSTVTDGTYFYIIKATGLDDQKYDLHGTVNVFQ